MRCFFTEWNRQGCRQAPRGGAPILNALPRMLAGGGAAEGGGTPQGCPGEAAQEIRKD